MRIIAGTLRGRRLKPPSWEGLRPTSDRLRETLFNILADRVSGARVLDGYAGTGAIGIEAISRGAAHVTFVERDARARALIGTNLARCGIRDGYAMIPGSFERAINELRARADRGAGAGDGRFDVVLLDPPYESRPSARAGGKATDNLVTILAATAEVIALHGIVVLEHARRRATPEAAGLLVRTRQVTAGDSSLSFYSCRP